MVVFEWLELAEEGFRRHGEKLGFVGGRLTIPLPSFPATAHLPGFYEL